MTQQNERQQQVKTVAKEPLESKPPSGTDTSETELEVSKRIYSPGSMQFSQVTLVPQKGVAY